MKPLLLAAAGAAKPAVQHAPLPLTTTSVPPAAPIAQTWFQQHAGWATHTFAAIGIIAAIGLIVLLAIQTTKQEGLSGTIGGRVDSAYKGRPGAEEQLKRITGFFAGLFVVAYVVMSLTGI